LNTEKPIRSRFPENDDFQPAAGAFAIANSNGQAHSKTLRKNK
jgi:hypothetical protein